MSEEKFSYEGYGALTNERLNKQYWPSRLLLIEPEVIFPAYESEPMLNRVEYETVSKARGWEEFYGSYAVCGWRDRVAELVAGFDRVCVFAYYSDHTRAEGLREQLSEGLVIVPALLWHLHNWGFGQDYDYYVEAFSNYLSAELSLKVNIGEVVIYLNKDQHFVEAVKRGLAVRHENIPITMKTVNPTLGLEATKMPLPNEFEGFNKHLERGARMRGYYSLETEPENEE